MMNDMGNPVIQMGYPECAVMLNDVQLRFPSIYRGRLSMLSFHVLIVLAV